MISYTTFHLIGRGESYAVSTVTTSLLMLTEAAMIAWVPSLSPSIPKSLKEARPERTLRIVSGLVDIYKRGEEEGT